MHDQSQQNYGRIARTTKLAKKAQTGRRKSRVEQGEETRARILQGALKQFNDNGYAGASVRDISADAGVTHAVIRLDFETKENLWKAAVDHLFAYQEATVTSFKTAPDDLNMESFVDWIRNYVRYCAGHPDNMRIMIHETIRDSDRLRWVVEKHLSSIHEDLRRLFERAVSLRILSAEQMEPLMYIFISSSQMIFALRSEAGLIHGVDVLDPAVIERHAEAIAALLVGSAQEIPAAACPT